MERTRERTKGRMNDPFYVVRNQVEQSLAGINSLFTRWRYLLRNVNTAKNEGMRCARWRCFLGKGQKKDLSAR